MEMTNTFWIKQDEKYIAKCSRAPYFPIVAKKAEGVLVEDMDGKEYIDMISSACVLNTGYNHPKILKAIEQQSEQYIHFANDYFYSEPQIHLAKELCHITPGTFEKKVIFGFSGSDAIDSAIKVCRASTKRTKIISFVGAYHGSTYGAISLSAIDLNMKRKIGPLLPDVYHLPYPTLSEKEEGETEEEFSHRQFALFKKHFQYYIPSDEVAGIFMEPIAGDIGLQCPPKTFMKLLREFCDREGILLVVDEIQQGFGRTGKWFSIEHFDIVPDVVVMGKAMGSGYPISAVVGPKEAIDAIDMPGQLFTLQGNAICATAALATIDVIKSENLLEQTQKSGEYVQERFKTMTKDIKIIKEIRGIGLSIGVELKDPNNQVSSRDIVKKICYRCFEKGLILIYLSGNTLRVQPPLVIDQELLKKAMDIIEEVFHEYSQGLIPDTILEKIKGW